MTKKVEVISTRGVYHMLVNGERVKSGHVDSSRVVEWVTEIAKKDNIFLVDSTADQILKGVSFPRPTLGDPADDEPHGKMFPMRPKKGEVTEPSMTFQMESKEQLEIWALRKDQFMEVGTSSKRLHHVFHGPSIVIRNRGAGGLHSVEYDVDSPVVWGFIGRLIAEGKPDWKLLTMTDGEYNTERDKIEAFKKRK
jgi:hypothetical protein